MTIKVVFMAMNKASQHPWKKRGNAEGMLYSTVQCRVMNAIMTLRQIKVKQPVPSILYPIRLQASYRELLMALISPQPCVQDFLLACFIIFSHFPSWDVYLLLLAGLHTPAWAHIPIC